MGKAQDCGRKGFESRRRSVREVPVCLLAGMYLRLRMSTDSIDLFARLAGQHGHRVGLMLQAGF
jgi:hypothetical protein